MHSAPAAIEHFETYPGVANGAIDRTLMHYSGVPHSPPTADSFDRALRRMHYAYGKNYLVLMINDISKPGLLSEETRDRFIKTLRDSAILPAAGALLILSPGLLGVTTRSIITGLLLASRPRTPTQVFGALPAAVSWLAQQAEQQRLPRPLLFSLAAAEAGHAELRQSAHTALHQTR